MSVAFRCLRWEELDRDALYDVIMLREAVFVVEQTCAFQDADGKDRAALHLLGADAAGLVAYARIFGPGVDHAHAVIGRVVVAPRARGSGLGRPLMQAAIAETRARFGAGPIHIGAQARLEAFYASLGFVPCGPAYDEDGILHLPMLLAAS